MIKTRVTTAAAANIALVKYWGKSDVARNQPATPSLSIGLEDPKDIIADLEQAMKAG